MKRKRKRKQKLERKEEKIKEKAYSKQFSSLIFYSYFFICHLNHFFCFFTSPKSLLTSCHLPFPPFLFHFLLSPLPSPFSI